MSNIAKAGLTGLLTFVAFLVFVSIIGHVTREIDLREIDLNLPSIVIIS